MVQFVHRTVHELHHRPWSAPGCFPPCLHVANTCHEMNGEGTMADGRLEGKIVLVTGIGGGMGRVTARLFAREGATVVGCDIDAGGAAATVRLVEADGGLIESSAPVDLSSRENIDRWIGDAVKRYGRIDVLYNN